VLVYTMAGGMWSVALTDFLQAAMIIAGMAGVAWVLADLAGGPARVFTEMASGERMRFLPEPDARSILAWLSAGLVVFFGSVPQQDVLQRVKSAKDERTAVAGSLAGGLVYLVVALVPIFLVCAAALIDPALVSRLVERDYQLILPTLVLLAIYIAFAVGIGAFLAALQVMLRDVEHGLASLLLFVFYATPILYPATLVPQPLRDWLWMNPFAQLSERLRESLLLGGGLHAPDALLAVAAVVVLAAGLAFFERLAPHFEDFL